MNDALGEIDLYFLQKEEPTRSYLLALRSHILKFDNHISEAWKYKMPFFCYHGRMLCYLWIHKQNGQPYIGFVDGNKIGHPQLIMEKRARMKILLLNPEKDIPVRSINQILKKALALRNDSRHGASRKQKVD